MRSYFLPRVLPVIMLLFSSYTPCFAQGYGITAQAQVNSVLAPYTLDGVQYDPACIVNAQNPVNQAPQLTYSMAPFQCGGSYTGYDIAGNGLFTETAIEYVNAAQVYEGTSFVVASMNGGTAAPDISVGSSAYVYLVWTDTVTVGGLPIWNSNPVASYRLHTFVKSPIAS